MSNFKNISDISLNQNEYCILHGWQYYNNSNLKIKIPKLMTNVTSSMNDPFNRNILVNSKDCKPSIDNSLYVQDYVTVRRSPQCSLSHKIATDDETYLIPDGLGLTCLCVNGNYKNMTIIDSV